MFSGVFGIGFFMLLAVIRSFGGTRGSIGFLSSASAITPILEHTNTATRPERERFSRIRLTRMEGLCPLLLALETRQVLNKKGRRPYQNACPAKVLYTDYYLGSKLRS